MESRRPLSTSRTFYLLGLGHQRSSRPRPSAVNVSPRDIDRPGPIATNRYAGIQSGDTGASSKSTGSLHRHERFPPAVPDIALRRRAVQHGLCRFPYLPDPAVRPVAWVRCLRGRHPCRRPVGRRHVSGDPYRRFDGPVRHAQSHAILCLDGDGFGAALSVSAVVLALVAAATDQRRRRVFRLVRRADPDRSAHPRRRAISRPVHLLRAARLDHGADPCRRGLGFRRRLAGLPRRHRVGQRADHSVAARAGGGILRTAAIRWNGPSELPCPRRLASTIGLPQLNHANRDSSDSAVDGDYGDAKHDLQHPDISLRCVSEASGTRRHDHRHPVRCRRDCERVRCPLRPAGDAPGRCAAHDAQRHRVVDPADRNHTALGRHVRASTVVPRPSAAGWKG